jgi:hypothetical protein
MGAPEPLLPWKAADPPAAGAVARARPTPPAPRNGRSLAPRIPVPPAAAAPACALLRLALLDVAAAPRHCNES